MSDTYSIINKLGSSLLWISSTKDFLPAYLKHMCDDYEKDVGRKLIPVKVRFSNTVYCQMQAVLLIKC